MKQQLLTAGPLLDEQGRLAQPGYATGLVRQYDRSAIRAPWYRIKEWDYYLIICDTHAVALTIADNSYMGLDSVSLLDFTTGWQHTNSPMRIMTRGKTGFPSTSVRGDVAISGKGYEIIFLNDGETRTLTAHMDNFKDGKPIDIELKLTDVPRDSMVISTPFPGHPKHFYYNQKINCLRAEGVCRFDGKDDFMSPWQVDDTEGRIKLTFTPVMDRASNTDFVVLGSDQHQVFGYFDGYFVLDNGEKLEINHFLAFAEKVMNKW